MRSLFEIFDRTNLSCTSPHYVVCILRGRAVARPSCVYTVNNDGDDVVGNDVAFVVIFEISIFYVAFGIEILTPLPS